MRSPEVKVLIFRLCIVFGSIQLSNPKSSSLIKNEGQLTVEERTCVPNKPCDIIHTMSYTVNLSWWVDGANVAHCDPDGCPIKGLYEHKYFTAAHCDKNENSCIFSIKILKSSGKETVSLNTTYGTSVFIAKITGCLSCEYDTYFNALASLASILVAVSIIICIIGCVCYKRARERFNTKEERIRDLSAELKSKDSTIESLEKELNDLKFKSEPVPCSMNDSPSSLPEATRSDLLIYLDGFGVNARFGQITSETGELENTDEDNITSGY